MDLSTGTVKTTNTERINETSPVLGEEREKISERTPQELNLASAKSKADKTYKGSKLEPLGKANKSPFKGKNNINKNVYENKRTTKEKRQVTQDAEECTVMSDITKRTINVADREENGQKEGGGKQKNKKMQMKAT